MLRNFINLSIDGAKILYFSPTSLFLLLKSIKQGEKSINYAEYFVNLAPNLRN